MSPATVFKVSKICIRDLLLLLFYVGENTGCTLLQDARRQLKFDSLLSEMLWNSSRILHKKEREEFFVLSLRPEFLWSTTDEV